MRRLTYVAMSYRDFEIVQRLAERIREVSPSANVVVRHDVRHGDLDRSTLAGAVYRPSAARLLWGHWSMVEAQVAEMRWVRERLDPDWLVFISGQDFPVGQLAVLGGGTRR